jgi:hypothetical protein
MKSTVTGHQVGETKDGRPLYGDGDGNKYYLDGELVAVKSGDHYFCTSDIWDQQSDTTWVSADSLSREES